MVIYNKTTNSSTIIDAREIAPGRSTKTMLRNASTNVPAPLTIAIPGALRGFRYIFTIGRRFEN